MNTKKELISKLDLQNVNENSTNDEINKAIQKQISHYHNLLELETKKQNDLKDLIVNFEIARSGFLNSENPVQVKSIENIDYIKVNSVEDLIDTIKKDIKKAKQITVSKFKNEYCETLHTDTNGNKFVKIPVDNYVELNIMKNSIINAIDLISQAHEYNLQDENLSYTIYTLTNILKATSLSYESEGIDKLIEI